MESYKLIQSMRGIEGHKSVVYALSISENGYLFSGSIDRTVKVLFIYKITRRYGMQEHASL